MLRLETVLDRLYVIGNTFTCKDALRAAGARWDADRRQWFADGFDGRACLRNAIIEINGAADIPEDVSDYRVIAHCTYNGRPYYIIERGKGTIVRLAHPTAPYSFWVTWEACADFRRNNPPEPGATRDEDCDLATVGEYRAMERAYQIAYSDNDPEGIKCPRCDRWCDVDAQACPTCGNTTGAYADDIDDGGPFEPYRSPFSRDLAETPYDG